MSQKQEESVIRLIIWMKFLILVHPLNNIEITMYFNCECWFNGVFSRDNLPKIKDRAYGINLDDKEGKGTH